MNRDLEALILAFDAYLEARDKEAANRRQIFESRLDDVWAQHPGLSRDNLRKSIIKAHRQWAMKQDRQPPSIPPKA